jgi:hypothetical protein
MEGRSISATLRKYYVKLFVDPPGVRDGMVTSILDGYRYRTLRRPQRKGIKNKKSLPSRGKLKLKEVIFFIFHRFAPSFKSRVTIFPIRQFFQYVFFSFNSLIDISTLSNICLPSSIRPVIL